MLKKYNKTFLRNDLIAGLTLFVMLVPQSMAYAMLAGVPPVMGLYASTIPLMIYAVFASSKHLSVGPVAITSLLVFTGVSLYAEPGSSEYISLVLTLTLMVGVIQFLLGLLNGGFIVKFIPHSVLSGYTSAAAIVIAVSQFKHLLGIDVGNYLQVHLLFFDILRKINEANVLTVFVGLLAFSTLVLLNKRSPRIPGALLLVVVAIVSVMLFRLDQQGLQIIGNVPQGIPQMTLPSISFQTIQLLLPMAITISLIAFMESLAISKSIARIENYKIIPNKELTALGVSNIVGSFFQAFPINGSFSRTAINHQSGGRTQVTSFVTAICVIITLLFFTSLFYYLPTAILAAIIIAAVYKLVNIRELPTLLKIKPVEGWVWLLTFCVTLFVGIQWGIIIGAILTLILLIEKSAKPDIAQLGYVPEEKTFRDVRRYTKAITSEKVLLVRIDASLHFANISYIEEHLKKLMKQNPQAKWMVFDMSGVNDIDTVSIDKLEEMLVHWKIEVLFANMKGSIRETVNRVDWNKKYKEQQLHLNLEKLLEIKGLFRYFQRRDTKLSERSRESSWVNDYSI
ncbi:sulfate permease [Anaerobacillus alkaliphilus]|uniref:Sulfate permease n=1 Tax=Anaerobacillus alkaliphilus TaxID=1548597 RepID=A0A4Q0VMF1_9BACI|nr:sulfate permease [Anaerobacillus alkaliphilus]RXI96531.1 sulfate permease [Anaerobacillus alkaliphilus]